MVHADFEKTLEETTQIVITTTGRTTGREISNPVWFVRQGDKLYLLPVGGSDGQWYKNVRKTQTIRLAAGETAYTARATPITDPARVNKVVANFRDRYGARDVNAYYPKPDVAVEVATDDADIHQRD
jgi:deazaflavin-dependent oxidoreductase (nitroreductase family)